MLPFDILDAPGRRERKDTPCPSIDAFNISALPHTWVLTTLWVERCRQASVPHEARCAQRRTALRAGVCNASPLPGARR